MCRKWSRKGVLNSFCRELYNNNIFYSAKVKAATDDDTDEDIDPKKRKSADKLYVYFVLYAAAFLTGLCTAQRESL